MAKYKSKVDIIYERLMDEIKKGEYQQGDRLIINHIARKNDVSDIPVREAIRRLESEGYAKIRANQGAVVYRMNEHDLTSVFQVKSVLEGYAARLSVSRISPRRLEMLKEKNEEMRKAYEVGKISRYAELNRQFHMDIYKCAGNEVLYDMINDLWDKWSIGRMSEYVSPERFEETLIEHEILLERIAQGDEDEVEELMRQHKIKAAIELNTQRERRENNKIHE